MKSVLAVLLMAGMLVSVPVMMLHGRAPAAHHAHHDGHHGPGDHQPATPGQSDCCEWCLSNCVAPATLPHAPTIEALQIPVASVVAAVGPGRLTPARPLLLPYPLGPPASRSV